MQVNDVAVKVVDNGCGTGRIGADRDFACVQISGVIQQIGDRSTRSGKPTGAYIEVLPHVVGEQFELVRAIGRQNSRNILTGQTPVGVGEIEHRADVGIVLAIVAAERALEVAI